MVRLLRFFGLWSLLIVAGLVAVASSTFAVSFFRSDGLATGVLVVGLACVLPVSLAMASKRIYPAQPAVGSSGVCPHCGGPLAAADPGIILNVWSGV